MDTPKKDEAEKLEPVCDHCGLPAGECDCDDLTNHHLIWPEGPPIDPQEE